MITVEAFHKAQLSVDSSRASKGGMVMPVPPECFHHFPPSNPKNIWSEGAIESTVFQQERAQQVLGHAATTRSSGWRCRTFRIMCRKNLNHSTSPGISQSAKLPSFSLVLLVGITRHNYTLLTLHELPVPRLPFLAERGHCPGSIETTPLPVRSRPAITLTVVENAIVF